jgi:redox-sensitive bicupin YhaK (pirin superfamily)
MIEHRPFTSLGRFRNDWLDARHHFSFGEYYDPRRMGWGKLRVWNDDRVRPGTGFSPHGHRDMEIVTFVLEGAVSHADDQGNQGRTAAGEVQVMSAGSGIRHAEMNREAEQLHLFQIWIEPAARALPPRWETASFDGGLEPGLRPLVSDGSVPGTLRINQDARLLVGRAAAGRPAVHALAPGRAAYLVAVDGGLVVDGRPLAAGDAVAVRDLDRLAVEATADGRFVLADVPLAA